jgi:hypothetical protein
MPAEKVLYLSSPHPQSDTSLLPGKDVKVDGQAVHAVAAVRFEYVPPGHATHALALLVPETPENAPAGHDTQVVELLAPATDEYVPATQLMHALAPPALAYVPARQFTHTPLPAPENAPAGHATQTLALVAPVTPEYAPAKQFVQIALPELFLNFPAAHAMHEEPPAPVYPALHIQAPIPELNIGEFVFTGHAAHDV